MSVDAFAVIDSIRSAVLIYASRTDGDATSMPVARNGPATGTNEADPYRAAFALSNTNPLLSSASSASFRRFSSSRSSPASTTPANRPAHTP